MPPPPPSRSNRSRATGPAPVTYEPSLERIDADEPQVVRDSIEILSRIQRRLLDAHGRPMRAAHPHSHAVVQAELTVLDGLPPELTQGLFARPTVHPVLMRFSIDDRGFFDAGRHASRGLALKVMQVEGERLPGSEGERTQDFVLADAPSFVVSDARAFLDRLKRLEPTCAADRVRAESPPPHPLADVHYSQLPIKYGPFVAKLSVAPATDAMRALAGAPLASGSAAALRDAMNAHLAIEGGEWHVRVQLCMDVETMPIEDAAVGWPEDRSPWITVARLRTAPQRSGEESDVEMVDRHAGFDPWTGLAAHRPLGSIMRMRRAAYAASRRLRAQ